jgi:hypothetical protein
MKDYKYALIISGIAAIIGTILLILVPSWSETGIIIDKFITGLGHYRFVVQLPNSIKTVGAGANEYYTHVIGDLFAVTPVTTEIIILLVTGCLTVSVMCVVFAILMKKWE